MSKQLKYDGIEEFMIPHTERDPAWKQHVEPVVKAVDEDFFNYVMSFIYM